MLNQYSTYYYKTTSTGCVELAMTDKIKIYVRNGWSDPLTTGMVIATDFMTS